MFEFHVEVFLSFAPKFTIKNFNYDFDYSEESMNFFKKNYSGIINFDENFKKEYPKFFSITKYDSEDNTMNFRFEFGKFCNHYNITRKIYLELKKELKNFFPFPLIGNITVIEDKEEISVSFKSRVLHNAMFILVYPENDVYTLKYTSQEYCEFQLLRDLSEKEKRKYEDFLIHYRINNGLLQIEPFYEGYF